MKTTNFKIKYLRDVSLTINQLFEKKEFIVSVKKIREIRKIDNEDRSLINFYWHSFKELEKNGFLKNIGRGKYRILKAIVLSDVIPNFCENCNEIIRRNDYQCSFVNKPKNLVFYFCNSACKKEWISKKIKEV